MLNHHARRWMDKRSGQGDAPGDVLRSYPGFDPSLPRATALHELRSLGASRAELRAAEDLIAEFKARN